MNLKKSDKIVAIVGVLILIASAVLIAVYFSTEDDVGDTIDEDNIFIVEWKEDYGTMELVDEWVGKGEAYVDPFTVSEMAKGAVITKVSVRLQWEDDNTYGLIAKGHDKLSGTITYNGNTMTYEETTGDGNITKDIDVYDKPLIDEIDDPEITTVEQAEQYLLDHEQVKDKDSAAFETEISVQIGEKFKLFKPIASLLNVVIDKGNSFSLIIDYTYYYPEIPVEDTEGENNPPAETNPTGVKTYANLFTPMGKC